MIDLEHVFSYGCLWGEGNPIWMARMEQAFHEDAVQVTIMVELPIVAFEPDLWANSQAVVITVSYAPAPRTGCQARGTSGTQKAAICTTVVAWLMWRPLMGASW